MHMKKKKVFAAPRMLQIVQVLLEEDLLTGPSAMSKVEATGHEVEHYSGNKQNPAQNDFDGTWTIGE